MKFPSLFKSKRKARPGQVPPPAAPVQEEAVAQGPAAAAAPLQEPTAVLPRFQVTATDQVLRRGADSFTRVRASLRNAFTPSQPVQNSSMFAGRQGVLSTIIGALEDQRVHVVLYGDRGIGKTSLLHMLSEAAREARYIVVYTSCGATSKFDETFRAAALEIPLLFHSSYAPTTTEAEVGSTLADLLPETPVSPRLFGDMLARLTGTRAIIILDEFDRTESQQFRRDLAELVKILSDRSLRVQLVIAGVAADLSDLVDHIPSIRRNILAIQVPLMTDDEVEALIQNGERVSNVIFEPGARSMIKSMSSGSPYIANLLCHHAGLAALDGKRMKVTAEDTAAAVGQVVDEVIPRIPKPIRLQLDQTLAEAGEALRVLAWASMNAGGRFDLAAIDAAGSPENTAVAKKIAEQLAKSGTILAAHEDGFATEYSFLDDGVAAYIWFATARRDLERGARKTERKSAQDA